MNKIKITGLVTSKKNRAILNGAGVGTFKIEYKKGMELKDDTGDVRYVLEDQGDNKYVHLTGYDDVCMCEAWYTPEELEEEQEYKPTGKTVTVEDLDQDIFTINCTCCDSE